MLTRDVISNCVVIYSSMYTCIYLATLQYASLLSTHTQIFTKHRFGLCLCLFVCAVSHTYLLQPLSLQPCASLPPRRSDSPFCDRRQPRATTAAANGSCVLHCVEYYCGSTAAIATAAVFMSASSAQTMSGDEWRLYILLFHTIHPAKAQTHSQTHTRLVNYPAQYVYRFALLFMSTCVRYTFCLNASRQEPQCACLQKQTKANHPIRSDTSSSAHTQTQERYEFVYRTDDRMRSQRRGGKGGG